jgi:hypothetical protein
LTRLANHDLNIFKAKGDGKMKLNETQIWTLEQWLVEQQRLLGNGYGEGYLIMGAAVIWECGQ